MSPYQYLVNESTMIATAAIHCLEAKIRQSLDHYSLVMTFLQEMERKIGIASDDELLAMDKALSELHVKAVDFDKALWDFLAQTTEKTALELSLLNQRTNLLQNIVGLNETITTKAAAVKSLIAHELGTLRSGLSALKGYRQQDQRQGSIVNHML
jgi:hypothetical protein